MVRNEFGPDYDVAHFTPRYDPWDERLCLVPDGDLFGALRRGTASVVTDRVERFSTQGIILESQRTLPADITVTATGLELKLLGDVALSGDDDSVDLANTFNYTA